jgi:DNA-binding transcriptional regulator YiaG
MRVARPTTKEDAVTQLFPRTPNLDLRQARHSLRLSQAQFAAAVRATGNAIGAVNLLTSVSQPPMESAPDRAGASATRPSPPAPVR